MPSTALIVQDAVQAGVTRQAEQNSDAVNGNYVPNTGSIIILARNSGAGARYVRIQPYRTVAGQPAEPIQVDIAAGETALLGRYDRADFGSRIELIPEHAEIRFFVFRA